jgi:hypothetical protein
MKLSTISLVLSFAIAPVAARAMAQHRDVLHQVQRRVTPISAVTFVLAAKLGDDAAKRRANGGEVGAAVVSNAPWLANYKRSASQAATASAATGPSWLE